MSHVISHKTSNHWMHMSDGEKNDLVQTMSTMEKQRDNFHPLVSGRILC